MINQKKDNNYVERLTHYLRVKTHNYVFANRVDPDGTAPIGAGAVSSGFRFTLFVESDLYHSDREISCSMQAI